jgi:hypothetical protein
MEACDAADGCVDVAYVAPSCYLKNALGPKDFKAWVWNARYMAPAVTTTSDGYQPTGFYGNSTNGTASTGASLPLPTSTVCAANTTTFYPAANQVNNNDYSILTPKNQITLTYVDPDTLRLLALSFSMNYPTVVLEDSSYIDYVGCGPNIQVSLTDDTSYKIATSWPTTGFLIVTYFPGCNSQSQRGVYYVSSITPFPLDLVVGLDVVEVNLTDVATEMTIGFGSISSNATTVTSTCTAGVNGTAGPTPTGFNPSATTTLSPAVQAMVKALLPLAQYDSAGDLLATVPTQTAPIAMTADPFNPSDVAAQASLEASLADAGLPPVESVAAQVAAGLAGTCSNSTLAAAPVSVGKRKRHLRWPAITSRGIGLIKRKHSSGEDHGHQMYYKGAASDDSDSDGWDYACDDALTSYGELLGPVGEIWDGVCAGHDAYQAGQALDCLAKKCYQSETWYTTTTYTYRPATLTTTSFRYWWTAKYPTLSAPDFPWALDIGENGNEMTCINCKMNVNIIQTDGTITVNLTTKRVQSTNFNAGISWDADHVINVNTNGPWTSSFKYPFDAKTFNGAGVPGVFTITPSMIYNIAYSYSTNTAVNFTAGAHLHVSNATVNLNALSAGSASVYGQDRTFVDPTVLMPQSTFIYPVFSTGARVSMSLVMQASLSMSVNIMGQVSVATSQTMQNTVGMTAEYSTTAGACPANNLAVKSYVSTNNTFAVDNGARNNIYSGQTAGQTRCFAVPNVVPDADEIVALASDGAAFCTSYLSYTPTTSSVVITTTLVVPSTLTTTVTTTITSTPVVTLRPTYRFSQTSTSVLLSSTSYVYTPGTYSFPTQLLKRTVAGATPTAVALEPTGQPVYRRAVTTPTEVTGWIPAKISYACSQIATGGTTTTYTVTITSTSGSVYTTQTNTINTQAALSTATQAVHQTLTVATVTVTSPGTATSTIYTGCPLQTTETCIRITGHGAPQLEGFPLAYTLNGMTDILQFGSNFMYTGTTWYLASDGSLYALAKNQPYAVTANGKAPGARVLLGPTSTSNGNAYATCTKDCAAKTLTCCAMGTCMWSVQPQNLELDWHLSYSSVWPFYPIWGPPGLGGTVFPLTLTYEDVQCPCRS